MGAVGRFVFIDRDGTLIRDRGYVHRLEHYELLPGVVDALARLVRAGFGLAVVTNQSGIGRGYYDEAAYQRIRAHLEEAGIPVARHDILWSLRADIKPSEIDPAAYRTWAAEVGLAPG
mgnify:CR=1 FL=1